MDNTLRVINVIQASYICYKSNEECEVNLDDKAPHRIVFIFKSSDSVKRAQESYGRMVVNKLPLDVNKEDFDKVVNQHYDKLRDYVIQNRETLSLRKA